MTSRDHRCDESCKTFNILDIGNLVKAIDEVEIEISQFDRIIKSLKDLELDVYEDEAISSFQNARSRYVHILTALKRQYAQS
jgi:hypothetical protein